MINLIKFIKQDYPSGSKENPFYYIIEKCMEYFHADYCSYLAPDYQSGIWQVKTCIKSEHDKYEIVNLPIELQIGKMYSLIKTNHSEVEPYSGIEPGICNIALYAKKTVFVEDIKNNAKYKQQYVKQFEDVKHEIAVPLMCYIEGDISAIGVIVLDYNDLGNYLSSKDKIEKQTNFEIEFGNFVFKKIYKTASNHCEKIIYDISKLEKIDFDNSYEAGILNKALSELWPRLVYYSIWSGSVNQEINGEDKTFVRIASYFSDCKTNKKYNEETGIMDYIFSQDSNTTYGKILKHILADYRAGKSDNLVVRQRMTGKDHKSIKTIFNKFLYGENQNTVRDFHFIPIIENIVKKGKSQETVSCVIVLFFEDFGDIHIIKQEQIKRMSQLIYDRIKFSQYKKTIELQNTIKKISIDIFDNFKSFIKKLGGNLLNAVPCEKIAIWMITDYNTKCYSMKAEKDSFEYFDIEDKTALHMITNCLKEKKSRTSYKDESNSFSEICSGCHIIADNAYKSCMTVKVKGPKGIIRAILFFFNRKKPLLANSQAFSIIDQNSMEDISRLFGLILSLYDAREKERKLRSLLPHEFASPISALSNKLKDIENIINQLMIYLPKQKNAKSLLLNKKLSDCWLSCESIANNSENYIKYIKKDTRVTPEPVNLSDMIHQIFHIFSKKFKLSKQIYILIHGINPDQIINCQRAMLFSIIHNVFDNAYKYSHRYTVFYIKVSEDYTHIKISFINYGIGIGEYERGSLFDLFYQSKNIKKEYESSVQRSHGIGLGFAKWYVEECHKGKINFMPSQRLDSFNPFFLYIIKNIFNSEDIYNSAYQGNNKMLNAQVDESIKNFFLDENIKKFYKKVKPLGTLGEFLFKHILEIETFKNELVLLMPKKFKGNVYGEENTVY
ncbi:Histidine kinase domain-containing protein [Desulfonema limicola]|uniref:histidine kinase n=1 Tax=Desulfonema limicola TaxID=45656 RepID=A0A975GEP8_9BACT|nr:HAMP domain-containing sensor histidine kinase [Desulfonema limicola]QTA78461.1 Histidine kinase domain-containing protein [Desulfonema limicola]